ncbi:family A G protein-coupled receptor-like protein [Xylariaceae sp. FL0255]|nr:family A G protein-coupled receptor-like protein [Xylariaceae sp. FL0255]
MALIPRENGALNINPATSLDDAIAVAGSDWLYAVTAIYLVAFICILVPCFTSPESDRIFHYQNTLTVLIGGIVYYAEASDLGWSAVGTHQVFFVRYVNWLVAFPSIALGLGMLSNLSWTTIFTNIVSALVWVVTYIAATYTSTSYKWGFYAFGTFTYVILAMSTINESRGSAQKIDMARDYMILAGWANAIWLLYPIAFALTDGAHVLHGDGAAIFIGILDILIMPIWSILFIFLSHKWDYQRLRLAFSDHRFDPTNKHLLEGKSSAITDVSSA